MPETTDTLRWTRLRHRMLREVADGKFAVYVGTQWNLVRKPFTFPRGVELRTAHSLRPLITSNPTPWGGGQADAFPTDAGRSLLSRWDAEHPEGGDHAASDH